jgi:hypothetical protein
MRWQAAWKGPSGRSTSRSSKASRVAPGVIVAGLNPVNTDAIAMAVTGFDPMAVRGTPPFERCDSTLQPAESVGLGSRDLKRIEIAGTPISAEVRLRGHPPPEARVAAAGPEVVG